MSVLIAGCLQVRSKTGCPRKDGVCLILVFFHLWGYFQTKAREKLVKANNGNELDTILWASEMTKNENLEYFDPKKYIIHVLTATSDSAVKMYVENDFRVILSNYDALNLDCG